MAQFTIDTDAVERLLTTESPISLGCFEQNNGKPKILMVLALPELEERLREFTQSVLDERKTNP